MSPRQYLSSYGLKNAFTAMIKDEEQLWPHAVVPWSMTDNFAQEQVGCQGWCLGLVVRVGCSGWLLGLVASFGSLAWLLGLVARDGCLGWLLGLFGWLFGWVRNAGLMQSSHGC